MGKDEKQIGILGGSFDPVHMGHMGLAQETYDKFGLDQILFVPVFQSPNKLRTPLASTLYRVEMLRLAIKDNTNFSISDAELRREELSYTIDTLNYCELKFSDSELFLIIGCDNLLDLDSWKDSRKIMERCHILVASRPLQKPFSPGDKVLGLFNGDSPYRLGKVENGMKKFFHRETGRRLVVFDINPRDISSSAVRKKLAQGKPTKNLLPLEVEAYIIKHQIYQTKFQLNTG
jgi:nicotinate-nucleotide adenylyltransferase